MRVMAENPMGRQRSGWRYKLYRAGRGIRRNWGLYLLLLPAVVLLFCFNYLPMYGVQIAFKDFSPSQGIQGSPWVGLENFQKFFNSFQSKNLIWNTVSLSLYSLIAGFPFPIILALMVNQIRVKRFKQVLQVVTYLPHFISTVVMVGIMLILLSPSNGIYGNLARVFGVQNPTNIMGEASAFQHVYVWSDVWQHAGWDSIIYIAALAAVDPSLYEAATVDGASKIQRLWHIDLPFLIPTAVILLIIVENSFEHGFTGMAPEEKRQIIITARKMGDRMILRVRDNGRGMSLKQVEKMNQKFSQPYDAIALRHQKEHGIGLDNINDRLQIFSHSNDRLVLRSREGKYTSMFILQTL